MDSVDARSVDGLWLNELSVFGNLLNNKFIE